MIIGRPNKLYRPCKNIIMSIGHVVELSFSKDTNGFVTHVLFRVELHNTFITTFYFKCRNPTLAKCGGEAQHLEKLGIWSPTGLPNV
jgi:hypothetical protein